MSNMYAYVCVCVCHLLSCAVSTQSSGRRLCQQEQCAISHLSWTLKSDRPGVCVCMCVCVCVCAWTTHVSITSLRHIMRIAFCRPMKPLTYTRSGLCCCVVVLPHIHTHTHTHTHSHTLTHTHTHTHIHNTHTHTHSSPLHSEYVVRRRCTSPKHVHTCKPVVPCRMCAHRWNARQTLINLSMGPEFLAHLQRYDVPAYIHGGNVPTRVS